MLKINMKVHKLQTYIFFTVTWI